MAYHQDPARPFRGFDDVAAGFDAGFHRLFEQHVLAAFERGYGGRFVQKIGRDNIDHVDVVA